LRRGLLTAPRNIGYGAAESEMTRHNSRHSFIAMAGLLLVVGVSGCQYSYPFELQGVVKNAADGQPLAGVTIVLKNAREHGDTPFPVTTQADGAFSANFRVAGSQFVAADPPVWSLALSKDGFHDEVIDIRFGNRPESPKVTTFLVVVGAMRPK
jgi:hypothetical protein